MSNAADPPSAASGPVPPPRNNWGWIAFFVFVVVASIGVSALMIGFNLYLQLKPEQLETGDRVSSCEAALRNR